MRKLDQLCERSARSLAQRTSRRSLLASLGQLLTGAALLPLLPMDRAGRARAAEAKPRADSPEDCQYWKYSTPPTSSSTLIQIRASASRRPTSAAPGRTAMGRASTARCATSV